MISQPFLGLLALVGMANGHTPHVHMPQRAEPSTATNASSPSASPPLLKRDSDPSDMSWIKRWAAIGDSYTAGIGAGRPLGHRITADEVAIRVPDGLDEVRDNWKCSRYDQAYPKVIEAQFGYHIEKDGGFQYLACSGDRSEQIYQQATNLKGDLDFVTFTAGGNDLCLAGIIKDCIMVPYFKTSACNTVIAKAQENAKNMIKDNVKQILTALNDKMKSKDSIVVVNGYAQFFDATLDNCDHQSWDVFWYLPLGASYQALTISRRNTFNQLVLDINKAIREAVNDAAADSNIKYRVGYSEWDRWVSEEVDAQMCSPSSNGDYPDKNQPDMHFIKPDTHPWFGWQTDVERSELRKRDMDLDEMLSSPRLSASQKRHIKRVKAAMEARESAIERDLYDSVLYKSANPRAAVIHKLDRRAPKPPGCPGDGGSDMTFGLGMPDHIGQNFHPNEAGHVTIASFALAELMDLRSIILGVNSPSCAIKDEFTCFSGTGSKFYVSGNRTNELYEDFCKEVEDKRPKNTINWNYPKSYDEGTPEEFDFVVTTGNDVASFDKDQCVESFKKLINSCDTKDNPMNWKGGGRYIRNEGDYKYELNPRRNNRVWPWPKNPYGRCEGWYKVFFGQYTIEGTGFASFDYGQKSMRPNMDSCYGLGTTAWKFNYHDNPGDHNGYEWKATFNTPIWVRARCFKNNKVVKAAGGWTDGCKGND
ncbi:SGNH hydrolase [Amniculicola lignicola CBS 123094]|uniref:SGNH hydrolase n=1 Tax=Amniculicola lignicola CBS 123094 TaxID=1392246 RepID=A0A6A5X3D8_9PLEO|nr:SGNH hydrolase [Amniculicola lignicola CBS 123094]